MNKRRKYCYSSLGNRLQKKGKGTNADIFHRKFTGGKLLVSQ